VITSTDPRLRKATLLGRGNRGSVHAHPDDPSLCVKLFKEPLRGEAADDLLGLVRLPAMLRRSDADTLLSSFAWPREAFTSRGQVDGFAMDLASRDTHIELKVAGKARRELLSLKYLIYDDEWWTSAANESRKPSIDAQDRLEIAVALMDAIAVLNEHDLVYGDFSSNNIAVRLGAPPSIFILDVDSISTPEGRLEGRVGTPDWEAPDHLGPLEADRSLAALAVWRLLVIEPASTPSATGGHELAARWPDIHRATIETYSTGDASAFDQLREALRIERHEGRSAAALRRAASSGFARRVVLEGAAVRSRSDVELVRSATKRVEQESRADADLGTCKAARERLLDARTNWALDVVPVAHSGDPRQRLQDLVHSANYRSIVGLLSRGGLAGVEGDPSLSRALAHALIELGRPAVSVTESQDRLDVGWTWPPDGSFNAARVNVQLAGQDRVFSEVVDRQGSQSGRCVIQVSPGTSGIVSLALAVRAPSGAVATASPEPGVRFSIPVPASAPLPRQPRSSPQPTVLPTAPGLAVPTVTFAASVPSRPADPRWPKRPTGTVVLTVLLGLVMGIESIAAIASMSPLLLAVALVVAISALSLLAVGRRSVVPPLAAAALAAFLVASRWWFTR
jgi:hypothetical protein